ncbi:hypothetical protein BDF22DRAFT_687592 [Syncephalis plumigaleata]|nr:hypothetical protein BDF22DRAFT_687592 [Syncephalis plumigaleata]
MAVTYAELPRDGSFERIFNEAPLVFIVFGVIYVLMALAQTIYAVRYHNKHYVFFVLAYFLYAVDCFMTGTHNGTSILIPFWTYLIYAGTANLLDQWCKSMRSELRRASMIGRVIAVISMICIMLAFSVLVITRSLLRKGYIIQDWLVNMSTILHLIGLNLLMLMTGVLLKLSPSKIAFRNDRKRREIALLLGVYLLLLLHRVFTQVRVPYTEFAIFPLIGMFTLFPLNALEGYARPVKGSKSLPGNCRNEIIIIIIVVSMNFTLLVHIHSIRSHM